MTVWKWIETRTLPRLLRGDYTVARVHNEFGDQVCMLRLNGDRIIVRGLIPINL